MSGVIGILGGSFNPAHSGHVHLSTHARDILGLDEIVWLVANHNPFKPDQPQFAERYRSARRYAADWLRVSDFEYQHGFKNSFDSLSAWQRANPQQHCVLLMGADVFGDLPSWHRYEDILRLMPIAIAPRNGDDGRSSPVAAEWGDHILPAHQLRSLARSQAPALGFLAMPSVDISSSQQR